MPHDRPQTEKRRASKGTLSQLAEQVHFNFINSLFEVSLESPVSPRSAVGSFPIDEEALPTRADSAPLDVDTPSSDTITQTRRSAECDGLLREWRHPSKVQLKDHNDLQQPREAKIIVSSSSFPFLHEAGRYCLPTALPGTAPYERSVRSATIPPSASARIPSVLAIPDVHEQASLKGEDYITHMIRCQKSPGAYKRYIDEFFSLGPPSPEKSNRGVGKKKLQSRIPAATKPATPT